MLGFGPQSVLSGIGFVVVRFLTDFYPPNIRSPPDLMLYVETKAGLLQSMSEYYE